MSGSDDLDDAGRLNLNAKDAVRSYMLRLVAVPTLLLTIISGLGGFFLNKVAYQAGYQEAYQVAIRDILSTAKELGETKGYALDALRDVKTAATSATLAAQNARETSENATAYLNKSTEDLAKALANTPSFRQGVTSTAIPSFNDLKSDLAAIKTALSVWRDPLEITEPAGIPKALYPTASWTEPHG